ncbi:MAG: pyruvate ferredoxin oxidoreductase, partial [Syntrophobacteraceae bacterium]
MGSIEPRKDPFTFAKSTVCSAEAGKTGDWRSQRPVIDHTKCIPSKTGRSSCHLCWMFCPEGIVTKTVPVEIDLDFCKG